MRSKRDMQETLKAALEAAGAGDFERAQRFGEALIRKLENAAVFRAGQVQIDNPVKPWIQAGGAVPAESEDKLP